MNKRLNKKLTAASLATCLSLALLLALPLQTALAHEPRDVSDFNFNVGFLNEPAFEGLLNAVFLRVTKVAEHAHAEDTADASHDHSDDQTVGIEGLQSTLLVEVTYMPTGATQVMNLHYIPEKPGEYKSDFIPTAAGQYSFRFFGAIEGIGIDELFESGSTRFDDVQTADHIQFPQKIAAPREVESAVRGAQTAAQQAQDAALQVQATADSAQNAASAATTLAILGIAIGAIGVIIGAAGAFIAFRRKT